MDLGFPAEFSNSLSIGGKLDREQRLEVAIRLAIEDLSGYRGSVKNVDKVVCSLEESLINPKVIKIPVTLQNITELNENLYLNPPAIIGQIVEVRML